MHFSRWIVAIAFGLTVNSLQAQEQANTTDDGANKQETTPQDLPFGVPIRIIEDDEAADAREASERERDQRDQDDLIAQQRMADATEAMNEATQSMKRIGYTSLVLAFAGTAALFYSLALTRRAVIDTREIGEAQTRAYIHVKQAELRWLHRLGRFDRERRDAFAIDLEVENTGVTPARWYAIEGIASVMERPDAVEPIPIFTERVQTLRWGILTGRSSLTCPFGGEQTQPMFIDAGVPNRFLRIDGLVRYKTEFKETRTTPFHFFIEGAIIMSFFDGDVADYSEMRKRRVKLTRPRYDGDD